MKTPIDTVVGQIKEYDPERGRVIIECTYPDWFTMSKREYKQCLVQMLDSRPLSSKQRNSCYALINEIAEYTGMSKSMTKEWLKIKFLTDDLQQTADKIFSLSNAPMSLVCAFQKWIVRLIIDFEIPTKISLSKYVDDVQDYVYACAAKKKCCVCGQEAEAHHWKRIGMGADRKTMNHLGWPMEPLCRKHHSECHEMAQEEFDKKWHIEPIAIDAALTKVYGLNVKE